jgi:hypothetical protein
MLRNVFMVLLAAASPLLSPGTESKWKVMKGAAQLGTITVLTSANATRAEWKVSEKATSEVFIGTGAKSWMRATGGDIELSTLKAGMPERAVIPALLAPYGGSSDAKVESDAKGANKITIKSGSDTYTLTRTSIGSSNADASNFAVRPKSGSASRLAALSGNLLGPSDTSVAATAGGRGVGTKGLHLTDGGDYDAVEKLENRDAHWHSKLDTTLSDFQKKGKVGRDRGDQ